MCRVVAVDKSECGSHSQVIVVDKSVLLVAASRVDSGSNEGDGCNGSDGSCCCPDDLVSISSQRMFD